MSSAMPPSGQVADRAFRSNGLESPTEALSKMHDHPTHGRLDFDSTIKRMFLACRGSLRLNWFPVDILDGLDSLLRFETGGLLFWDRICDGQLCTSLWFCSLPRIRGVFQCNCLVQPASVQSAIVFGLFLVRRYKVELSRAQGFFSILRK
jgi:hypothetical protein